MHQVKSGLSASASVQRTSVSAASNRALQAACGPFGQLNRYENLKAQTFPELYETCAALLDRNGDDVELKLDERGVIEECSYAGDADCVDNCGEGFLIRSWDFKAR